LAVNRRSVATTTHAVGAHEELPEQCFAASSTCRRRRLDGARFHPVARCAMSRGRSGRRTLGMIAQASLRTRPLATGAPQFPATHHRLLDLQSSRNS
jgi:hypothetical protein